MAENKNPSIEEVNIFEIFENAKHAMQGDMTRISGKMEMLDELSTFFREKNLHVIRPVEAPAAEQPVEVAPAVEESKCDKAAKDKKAD